MVSVVGCMDLKLLLDGSEGLQATEKEKAQVKILAFVPPRDFKALGTVVHNF